MNPCNEPTRYEPFATGRYDVAPALGQLGDEKLFQIDREYHAYLAAKHQAMLQRPSDCYLMDDCPDQVQQAVAEVIRDRLVREYPDWFTRDALPHDVAALAMLVQEDLAVMSGNRLALLHVCFPSGWSPREKIGKSFADFHEPVPHMQEINAREQDYVDQMIGATSGLVRFVWGVQIGDRLDGHPGQPREPFDPARSKVCLRVERQTIMGLKQVGACLFTIRLYLYDACDVDRVSLAHAVRSMSQETLAYKGLSEWRDALLDWL